MDVTVQIQENNLTQSRKAANSHIREPKSFYFLVLFAPLRLCVRSFSYNGGRLKVDLPSHRDNVGFTIAEDRIVEKSVDVVDLKLRALV